jgi:hypothetical protein
VPKSAQIKLRDGLRLRQKYALALAEQEDGSGPLQPLTAFITSSVGSAIVNAAGPIRQIVGRTSKADKRYLVASGEVAMPCETVRIETL